jgi:dephospho-CoA kinase
VGVRTIKSLVQGRIHKLKNCVNSLPKSVFKDEEAVKCLSSLQDKYVIDEELQHTDHLFLGVACFSFMNFV